MSEGIKGTASFQCSNCHHEYKLSSEDFDFEAVSGSERGMGEETEYVSDFHSFCDECGQGINISFKVWEYPAGAINLEDHSETGAVNVQYDFQILHFSDDNSESQNRLLGSAAGGAILGASLGGPFGAIAGGIIGVFLGDSVNKSKKGGGNG